jgi:TPR repeat protein
MNYGTYGVMSIFLSMNLHGSGAVKTVAPTDTLCIVTSDGRSHKIDAIWAQESTYVANLLEENAELGSKQKPLSIPLTLEQIDELNDHLLSLKKGSTKHLKRNLIRSISKSDHNVSTIRSKIHELNELLKAAKLMGLKKVQPIVRAGFLVLLKKDPLLAEFIANPQCIGELELPNDVVHSQVKLLSDEDQEFFRAQLCVTVKSEKEPSSALVSPCGRYVLTMGQPKKNASFFEIWDPLRGNSIRQVSLNYEIKGAHFCANNQIVTWGKKRLDLWDSSGSGTCTPHEWELLIKESKRIWGTALSADGKMLAVVLDDKIVVLPITKQLPVSPRQDAATSKPYKILTAPAIHKKENKKSGFSKICFGHDDQMLIEVRPGGDLLFYRWNTEKCSAYKKGSGSDLKRWYVNGSKFITISGHQEARVWECTQDSVEPVNEGRIPPSIDELISQEEFTSIGAQEVVTWCDTGIQEFIDKLAFMTGTKMSTSFMLDGGAPGIRYNDERGERYQKLACPPTLNLQGAYLSRRARIFLGIGAQGILRFWHAHNPDVIEFLSSSMSLEQALLLQYLVNRLRHESSDIDEILHAPHLRALFEEWDPTFQTIMSSIFQALRNGQDDQPLKTPRTAAASFLRSSSSTVTSGSDTAYTGSKKASQKLARSLSHSAAPRSPRSPRPFNLGTIAVMNLSPIQATGAQAKESPRRASHAGTLHVEASNDSLVPEKSMTMHTAAVVEVVELDQPPTPRVLRVEQHTQPAAQEQEKDAPAVHEDSQLPSSFSDSSDDTQDDSSFTSDCPTWVASVEEHPSSGISSTSSTSSSLLVPQSARPLERAFSTSSAVRARGYSQALEAYTSVRRLYQEGSYQEAYRHFSEMFKDSKSKLYKALAAHFLGEMHLGGVGTELDLGKACAYFEKAASQDVDKALLAQTFVRLGELYSYGYGVQRSQMKALYYLNQVIAHGQDPTISSMSQAASARSKVAALYLLYRAHAKELRIGTDEAPFMKLHATALTLCESMCEEKGSDAGFGWLYKGRFMLDQAREVEEARQAMACFVHAAESSDQSIKAEAHYRIGKLYCETFIDCAKARDHLEKALEGTTTTWVQPMAQLFLGHVSNLEESRRNESSYARTIGHYEKVLLQHYNLKAQCEAAYHLARTYEHPGATNLVPQMQWEKVVHYDSMATALGEALGILHVDAHVSLARQHYRGTPGVEVDLSEAYKQYMIVAQESHKNSYIEEALCALADLAQRRGAHNAGYSALECYTRLLALCAQDGYTASIESEGYRHKALLELARHEIAEGERKRAEAPSGKKGASPVPSELFAKAVRLLGELVSKNPKNEILEEAQSLQAQITTLCTRK